MTEILTESFCERCGTRYTFESSAPRRSRLGRVRTLSKGVRNFVMSDETSFSEAMAEARSEEELAATAHQLDAFHHTFNFCLTCRQYTCGDCWNSADGRCLTCAPLPGQEDEGGRLIELAPLGAIALDEAGAGNGHPTDVDLDAWPEMDLPPDRLARVLDVPPQPETTEIAGAVAPDLVDAAPGPGLPAAAAMAAGAAAAGADGRAAGTEADSATGEPTPPTSEPGQLVPGMAPGQSLDDAIAAYEATLAAAELASAGEPATAGEVGLDEDIESVESAPAGRDAAIPLAFAAGAATARPDAPPTISRTPGEAEPAAAEPAAAAAAAAERAATPEPPGPSDHVEQPTWPVPVTPAASDGAEAPLAPPPPAAPPPAASPRPWLTVAPEDAPPPEWPASPQWPAAASRSGVPLTLGGRPVVPEASTSAMWAASAQEVLAAASAQQVLGAAPAQPAISAPPTAQPCVSCGLSLSANARFCRRCGARQT